MKQNLPTISLLFCICFIFSVSLFAQDELDSDIRQKTFESVWTKISEKFYDPEFKGVDWNAVKQKYQPLVEKTVTSDEFHSILNKMVKEIKESHLSVNPPPKEKTSNHVVSKASIGVELAWIENQILITMIEPDSPANLANLQIGDSIISIDGISIEDVFQKFELEMKENSIQVYEWQKTVAVTRILFGSPDSLVKLNLLDLNNNLREVFLKREISKLHGAFKPPTFQQIEKNIGYIRIPIWAGKLNEKMDEAFQEFAESKAVIIDLRGNIGGIAELITNLTGKIMKQDGSLGEFRYRNRNEQFAFKGTGEKAFKGNLIILIDEKSASSSEVFSGGLQDLGRATVIGTRSSGAVLLSLIEILPSGGSMLYPVADFYTPKGKRLEGNGVNPDIEVKRTRRALIENRDLILEKAIAKAKETEK